MPITPRSLQQDLDSAYQEVTSLKELVAKCPTEHEDKQAILQLLEHFSDELSKERVASKSYTATSDIPKETYQRLHALLQKIGTLPIRNAAWKNLFAINAAQVALFWQVMYGLLARLDAFDRESVQPKRYRVQKVSNERLDKR